MVMNETPHIHWRAVLIAAVLSEVAVIALLSLIIVFYRVVVAPGAPAATYAAFGERAGYYIAPLAAGVATCLAALWVGHRLARGFVLNGVLIGLAAVVLTSGFLFVANPDDRFMYVVSYVLRVLGGWIGGILAQRTRTQLGQGGPELSRVVQDRL
jgi:hypothetical protein